jgi:hypothetical protein
MGLMSAAQIGNAITMPSSMATALQDFPVGLRWDTAKLHSSSFLIMSDLWQAKSPLGAQVDEKRACRTLVAAITGHLTRPDISRLSSPFPEID